MQCTFKICINFMGYLWDSHRLC